MTSDCLWLIPRYGWKDDMHGIAADKLMRGDPPSHLDDGCGWAEAHPEIFEKMPEWLKRDAIGSPGWREKHCTNCSCYEPRARRGGGHGIADDRADQ